MLLSLCASVPAACAFAGAGTAAPSLLRGPAARSSAVVRSAAAAPPPCPPSRVVVLGDAAAVQAEVCARLQDAAEKAVRERGHFAVAVPGGSVLGMLEGFAADWAADCTLAWVNHKAVPLQDSALSTEAKAQALFLSQWQGARVVSLGGSGDAAAEATLYETKLKNLPGAGAHKFCKCGFPGLQRACSKYLSILSVCLSIYTYIHHVFV